jgi:hypothetical protein
VREVVAFAGCLVALSGGATIAPVHAATPEQDAVSQIEVQARELTEQGARSEAVYVLQRALGTYRDAALRQRIEADIRLFSLEGHPAPHLQTGVAIGARVPTMKELDGKVVLLFFWAHWCADCKPKAPWSPHCWTNTERKAWSSSRRRNGMDTFQRADQHRRTES